MHKIAIIKLGQSHTYDSYGDSTYEVVANSITEWEEVTHEDFILLTAAQHRFEYRVVEQVTDLKTFIPKTVADYKAILKKEEQDKIAAEKKRKDAALAKKMKKEFKDKESKLELFRKLQAELGDEVK